MSDDCVFCKIANKQMPVNMVYEDDLVIVFKDINPQVPCHMLLVPKEHITSMNDLVAENAQLLGHMAILAKDIAKQIGIAEDGWRLVINCGPDAKQTVFHLHLHLLGGRPMTGQMA